MADADLIILLSALALGAFIFLRLVASARHTEVLQARRAQATSQATKPAAEGPPEVSGFDS
jgi:hypothetical protein